MEDTYHVKCITGALDLTCPRPIVTYSAMTWELWNMVKLRDTLKRCSNGLFTVEHLQEQSDLLCHKSIHAEGCLAITSVRGMGWSLTGSLALLGGPTCARIRSATAFAAPSFHV